MTFILSVVGTARLWLIQVPVQLMDGVIPSKPNCIIDKNPITTGILTLLAQQPWQKYPPLSQTDTYIGQTLYLSKEDPCWRCPSQRSRVPINACQKAWCFGGFSVSASSDEVENGSLGHGHIFKPTKELSYNQCVHLHRT